MAADQRWRGVVSALDDPARRVLYARIVLAADAGAPLRAEALDPADARRLRVLTASGMVAVAGEVLLPGEIFGTLLSSGAPRVPSGPERFLIGGRLRGLPRRARDRTELFGWVARRVLTPAERLGERELTARLAEFADDPVALRRQLVDAGELTRSPDGTDYRLAEA